jgi:hypothetical protein
MRRIDRVEPLRRYRVPRYPSHMDPDPTLHPYPVPFPFHRELVRAVAGVGIAAALGCGDPAKPVFTNPKNPFLLKDSGLPHHTSPYGTGAPSYVEDEDARKVIERVFRDEGFSLESHVSYDRDGVAFRASGFDPKRRIGYVFGDWRNLDEDAVVSWQIDESEPEPADDPAAIREWFDRRNWKLERMPEEIRKEAARIRDMTDGKEMADALRKLRVRWHAELLSLAEIRKLEEEAPRKKDYVAVISQFDERLETGYLGDEDEARAREQLELLERNVREYIAWARTQGLQ